MSSDLIAEITDGLREACGEDSGLGAIIKFDFKGAGVTRLDGRSVPNQVSNDDGPADCTVTVSAEDVVRMRRGDLDPAMAYLRGKMKVNGDMKIALKAGSILKKALGR